MNKTKVCILQNGLARGGTDTFVINLCKTIDKEKFDVTVVNPSSRPESNVRLPDLLATGVRLLQTSDLSRGLMSRLRHLWILYKLLRKERFDVFQTNIDLFNGPNLFVAWLARVPIRCCHSHNGMQQKELVEGSTFSIRLYQWAMRFLCWHFSNRRCGCSAIAMDFLYKGRHWQQNQYPAIINNGIDLEVFRQPLDVAAKKKELGLTANYNIVTVGRIIPQKNPIFIAETISVLCRQRNDCDFVWVGIGEQEGECRQIFERNGVASRVHFLGSRGDVPDILRCCNLFFFPSCFEGLSIANIEAQAAGLPCVNSNAISRESDCGASVFLSLDASQEQWVQTMSSILDGKIILKVDNNKLQQFSVENMTRQMQTVFQ